MQGIFLCIEAIATRMSGGSLSLRAERSNNGINRKQRVRLRVQEEAAKAQRDSPVVDAGHYLSFRASRLTLICITTGPYSRL